MSTIPASQIVSVIPGVLAAGGTGLNGTGLMLDNGTRIPVGSVLSFNSSLAVSNYFGSASKEAAEAAIYFAGFNNATILPSTLLMAQYYQTAVAAFLRGGNISGLTLAQLQAISGVLNVTIDGYAHNAASLNLSTVTSFSNAASAIQTAINASLSSAASVTAAIAAATFSCTGSISGNVLTVTAVASGTIVNGAAISGTGVTATTITGQLSGTTGGIGTYAVATSQIAASTTIAGTYGTMTVSAVASGSPAVGQTVTGGTTSAGTIITQIGTFSGTTGTLFVNLTQAVSSGTLTCSPTAATVTFDSVSGGFVITSGITGAASTIAFATGSAASSLLLTSATGAVTSQGAAPVTPSTFMTSLIVVNQAWVNFMTIFDPDGGSGNVQKQAFASWKGLQNNRYAYFCWDPDASPAASSNAASSLGQILKANNDSGTMLIWEGGGSATTADTGYCAFNLGLAASINYNQTNGRPTFAFKAQPGLAANVTDPTTAGNLLANGYNFYGAYGSASSNFVWNYPGSITGPYLWADSFDTQVWLNTYFQAQLLNLFQNSLSVPFTQAGVSLIQQTCQTVIQAGLLFGAFAPNVLTAAQIAQVNAQAGAVISNSLQANGYYLQVNVPGQTIQAVRGPWSITFWYIDRESVQQINLSSVLIP